MSTKHEVFRNSVRCGLTGVAAPEDGRSPVTAFASFENTPYDFGIGFVEVVLALIKPAFTNGARYWP